MDSDLSKTLTEEEKILAEKQDLNRHVKQVLSTPSGEKLFKHLFEVFAVGGRANPNLREGDLIQETTFFAAGNEIYQLAMRSSPQYTTKILIQMEEERKNV